VLLVCCEGGFSVFRCILGLLVFGVFSVFGLFWVVLVVLTLCVSGFVSFSRLMWVCSLCVFEVFRFGII